MGTRNRGTRNRAVRRLRMLAIMALGCVLVFDTAGIVVNRITADEAARVAAIQASEAIAPGTPPTLWHSTAHTAASRSLSDQSGIELVEVRVEAARTVVSVRRSARVLLASRISSLTERVSPVVTAEAPREGG